MEYEPEERRPLMRTISEEGVFDPPQTPVIYNISRSKRRLACGTILLTEMLERLAYYGIVSNLIMFLIGKPFNWIASKASHIFFAFTGLSYIFSVIGGLVADTCLGRFRTIWISLVIYSCGIVFFLLLGKAADDKEFLERLCNCEQSKHNSTDLTGINNTETLVGPPTEKTVLCLWPLLTGIVLTAIAGGSMRANLSPFGAEQVKHEGPDMIRTFFNWFYWAINIGSLLALAGVAYVQQNVSFFIGYAIVAGSLVLALFVFVSGKCTYLMRKPTGSVLPNTFKIIGEAFKRRGLRKETNRRRVSSHMLTACPKITFLDMAKKRYGGSFHDSMVEDVKSLKKVIGVFILLIPYWMSYYQMQSTFVLQGVHMDLSLFTGRVAALFQVKFPVASLAIFDVIIVILLLPILDRCIYPCLVRRGYNISLFYRILVGMIFSILGVCAAGVLEIYRRDCANDPKCNDTQDIMGTNFTIARMTIFCQVPQFVLIGISEALASVAALEYAYSHAPKSMQGLIMGLFCLSNGIGALCGSALMALVSLDGIEWFTSRDGGNINEGHLAYYFFLLAGIQVAATLIFSIGKARSAMGKSEAQHGAADMGPRSRQVHVQRKNSTSSSGE
ncbi:solute carrier family 15 member 4-like [Diadema antillarum]|uniref:solute carrier family 15 member 4-like n=1 Tax=Diadema antillarum TaxID=105358 RepID=UPI003A842119